MSPENPESFRYLNELISSLDEDTLAMSGGFHRLEVFERIVEHGEAALPRLLDKDRLDWWRIEAISVIAYYSGNPIYFPDKIQGRYNEVADTTINWAKKYGYITDTSSNS